MDVALIASYQLSFLPFSVYYLSYMTSYHHRIQNSYLRQWAWFFLALHKF